MIYFTCCQLFMERWDEIAAALCKKKLAKALKQRDEEGEMNFEMTKWEDLQISKHMWDDFNKF